MIKFIRWRKEIKMSLFDRFKTPADEADVRNLQDKILELCCCGDDTYDI